MTEQEKRMVEQVKREALISLIASLAKAMGAKVIIYNPEFGEFALKMDPLSVDFFGSESVVQALGGVQ